MNKLKVSIKIQYIATRYVEGFINHHRIPNKDVYDTTITLLKAIEKNRNNLGIIHPKILVNDLVYVISLLHASDGPNDLNYIISILLPKIQTINNISDLIPIVDDLVGYRGFSELTRLSNSLIENLYTS